MEHLTTLLSCSQFLPAYLNQVFVGTGSLVVGSLDRLEVRLLSWRPLLLVGSGEFGLWGLDDVLGLLERLDVRLLSWRPSLLVGGVGFGLWGLDCMLDDVFVICLLALATGDAAGVGVLDDLRFSC